VRVVSSGDELLRLRAQADSICVSDALSRYALALVRATRELAAGEGRIAKKRKHRVLAFGASPRASLALVQSARALAFLRGKPFVAPELVQEVFGDALRHRVGLAYEAEAEGLTADAVLAELLEATSVPQAGA
jgi:MoxR-like ATPase